MTEIEIVGVVEDAAYRGLREGVPPTLYRPAARSTGRRRSSISTVRTPPGGAAGLQPALTKAIRRVNPTLGVSYRSMTSRLHDQLTEVRTVALLSGVLRRAGAAARRDRALWRDVVRRQRAAPRDRHPSDAGRRQRRRPALRARTRGSPGRHRRRVGLAASLALSPVVRTLLYELEPRDPVTMTFAAAALAFVGLIAGWLPARRASRIDPAQVPTRRLSRTTPASDRRVLSRARSRGCVSHTMKIGRRGTPPCRRSSFAPCARCPAGVQAGLHGGPGAPNTSRPESARVSRIRQRSRPRSPPSQASSRVLRAATAFDERVERLAGRASSSWTNGRSRMASSPEPVGDQDVVEQVPQLAVGCAASFCSHGVQQGRVRVPLGERPGRAASPACAHASSARAAARSGASGAGTVRQLNGRRGPSGACRDRRRGGGSPAPTSSPPASRRRSTRRRRRSATPRRRARRRAAPVPSRRSR